ncbi:hypothetical protein BH09MYX1_BH09MYX1_19580 [soil metagenome]
MRFSSIAAVLALALVDTSAAGSGSANLPLAAATRGRTESGVMLLRPVPSGRVRMSGAFTMGSQEIEVRRGVGLCEREPLGTTTHRVVVPPGIETSQSRCLDVGLQSEMPAHRVTLSPYLIDRTEVTVEAYDRCVHAGACDTPGFNRGDAHFDRPDFPVTHVTREDGASYCAWAHGRLPTEAEWEFAARGVEQRTFPWGELYNPHLANHGSFAVDDLDATDGFLGLAPVGSFPDGATPEGVLDLAGNVAEWVTDLLLLIQPPTPPTPPPPRFGPLPPPPQKPQPTVEEYSVAPQVNPVSTGGGIRVARGGSYDHGAYALRSAARMRFTTSVKVPSIGFRCAETL